MLTTIYPYFSKVIRARIMELGVILIIKKLPLSMLLIMLVSFLENKL